MTDTPKTVYVGAGGAQIVAMVYQAIAVTVGTRTMEFRDVVEATNRAFPAYSREEVRRSIWHMLASGGLTLTLDRRIRRGNDG